MRSLTERARQTGWGRRACAMLALGLMVGALSACETLLDVDLPAELTDQALDGGRDVGVRDHDGRLDQPPVDHEALHAARRDELHVRAGREIDDRQGVVDARVDV